MDSHVEGTDSIGQPFFGLDFRVLTPKSLLQPQQRIVDGCYKDGVKVSLALSNTELLIERT